MEPDTYKNISQKIYGSLKFSADKTLEYTDSLIILLLTFVWPISFSRPLFNFGTAYFRPSAPSL